MLLVPPRVAAMFRNRERMVKIMGIVLAVALLLTFTLSFLASSP
jgi:hypothetical protein